MNCNCLSQLEAAIKTQIIEETGDHPDGIYAKHIALCRKKASVEGGISKIFSCLQIPFTIGHRWIKAKRRKDKDFFIIASHCPFCGTLTEHGEEEAAQKVGEPTDPLALIQAERQRQKTNKGYSPEHDDTHTGEELACAAAIYALPGHIRGLTMENGSSVTSQIWPFRDDFQVHPEDRIRDLEKAGALIVAEIERLQRLKAKASAPLSVSTPPCETSSIK